ncbi:MAG: HlyD family efflux transporter periplasmic adaptor subunit [Geobacteraceae bacterium]|nr:HlyD family efflux transporter periplasmic adaptor subunit [Geobacteraceae bacterium]
MKKPVISAVFVAVLVLSAVILWQVLRKPELPEGIAYGNGRIDASEYDIATKQAGRLDSVYVQEGDMVAAHRVLAVMNTDDLLASLKESDAHMLVAESDQARARAAVAQQESEQVLVQKDFDRFSNLYKQEVISRQNLDQASAKKSGIAAVVRATQAQLAGAASSIEMIKARTQVIKNNIEDARLKSPVEGRVLYRLAEPGEVLPAGGKVLTVLDLSDVYMTIFLPSEKAGRLTIGDEARIILDAAPDFVIPATVSFVSARAQFTPKEVETRTEREKLMFRVKLKIDPALLKKHIRTVKTGLPGVAYVRLTSKVPWPENLHVRLPL